MKTRLATGDSSVEEKIETLEELSLYLFDLANTIHEHRDMLFRLSDAAKAQADAIRRSAGPGTCS